ncbi:microviridin/marinostatin family tricyclic proteinase inhibitor [Nostoc sp. JL33]|uniref:microviridin/marinostatin family tricyclic proteinase inhibitor n=1 Tax=Nostoc sp. JL33 TaxID=2815396 RepID=UPI0025DF7867|nr:microviridin/marinostatin family tricyclic proteinase inhibitor [Nostoc sp. JL33]MBN3873083.1 microviridin/marinostatin family tricyclic proteinase inhibitor [Nostoc sp. JL33]
MSEIKPEDLNSQAVPFFARFLEGQNAEDLCDQESEAISGGQTVMTQKYPSDSEDGVVATKKYPSDSDEQAVTHKCHSDHEDGRVVTLKYPSDGDDALPAKYAK